MSYSFKSVVPTVLLAVTGLLVALALAWLVLYSLNFSYGFWHDHGGIKEAIAQYGNENEYREGFADTSRAQRVELFRAISNAIHAHGFGLAEIQFEAPGREAQTLLREPEVEHLQDVANLIDAGLDVALFAFLIWGCTWVYFALSHRQAPKLWHQAFAIGAVLVSMGFVVVVIGPVKVFYWLHTVLFPEEHQWFFYYQESLMSTMMHAPYLFGWIAIEWVVLTVILFLLIQGVMGKLLKLFVMGK